jgi:hypothetical protein
MAASHQLPADNLEFAWDRRESAETLRAKLADESSPAWPATAAWLLREARVDQVWPFLSLRRIASAFPQLAPLLGRRRPLWEYILRTAREMGRI